jgi:tRNA modification GTPase
MSYYPDDTICAIGTAGGGAARSMVRISGPDSVAIVARVFNAAADPPVDEIRQPTVVAGRLHITLDRGRVAANPPLTPSYKRGESSVPCDLFLWPTNRSYTREPVAELHTVGSAPLLQAVLAAVCRAGARLAEPGEFTLRAFLAGRIDLTQAEAVLGVIDASGRDELDSALAQLAGGLARPLHQLRANLLQLLAELEAGLDFVDEDIRFISRQEVLERLQAASALLESVSQQMTSRHTGSQVLQVALVGRPNVGKSSLFNAVVSRLKADGGVRQNDPTPALVSPQRGTTRDYLTATISLAGFPCELVDTAGVEIGDVNEDATSIDSASQAVAVERGNRAAVRAYCVPASELAANDFGATIRLVPDMSEYHMVVITKSDLGTRPIRTTLFSCEVPVVVTSSYTGEGLDQFSESLRKVLARDVEPRHGQIVPATVERCSESIRLAATAVQAAAEGAKENAGDELVAAELRVALAELGKVVGAVYTDDLLDRIFKTFCIGK